jgi:hypothetical protein
MKDNLTYYLCACFIAFGGGVVCGLAMMKAHLKPQEAIIRPTQVISLQVPEGDIRSPGNKIVVYKGDHPPEDKDALWCDTTVATVVWDCKSRFYKNGKWVLVLPGTIYKEDYK